MTSYKIKIEKDGWECFNGFLGSIEFENGVSVKEVSEQDANRIGSNITITRLDKGTQVGSSVIMSEVMSKKIETEPKIVEKPEPKVPFNPKYSKQSLEETANLEGIKAIREIANEFGVKGVQISYLISEIMKKQREEFDRVNG